VQIPGKYFGALAIRLFCPGCLWIERRAKLPWPVFRGMLSWIDSYSKKVVHSHFAAKLDAVPRPLSARR
jgi:hypothetical protein